MPGTDEFIRLMAAWALVHETADEGWKAAVARGQAAEACSMDAGPEAFVDGLSALIAEEKERLKSELAAGEGGAADRDSPSAYVGAGGPDLARRLETLAFEVGELRGMIESMQTTLDALARRSGE